MHPKVLAIILLIMASARMRAAELPSYKGLMRIPADLLTAEGVVLERGQYELEVRPGKAGNLLTFSFGGKVKAIVKPLSNPDPGLSSAHIPLVGTHYLRSSAEPVLTGEERRFSKTGAAQYEEENRDWKATLRVYKCSTDGGVYFLFQVREEHGRWSRSVFRLILGEKSKTR